MNDMYAAWKDFFAPAFQKLLDAEMEAKLGYSKNERTNNENFRNGYYQERPVSTEMEDIPIKVPRDRNGEIESDLVPKYSRTVNGFDEKVIAMYALGLLDKDIQRNMNGKSVVRRTSGTTLMYISCTRMFLTYEIFSSYNASRVLTSYRMEINKNCLA